MVDGASSFRRAFELVVVRHGRTAWNRNGKFQGHADVPLDEIGIAQAHALRHHLADRTFDHAVTSDLARARETIRIVLADRATSLECDERFREMRFGAWEGLTWAEIVARHPDVLERSPAKPKYFTPQDGEPFDTVCERVAAGVGAIGERVREGDVVLVGTHAGALHALLCVTLGVEAAEALSVRFDPGTVTRLALGPVPARVLELNASPAIATTS